MTLRRLTGLGILLAAGSLAIGPAAEAQVAQSGAPELAGIFAGRRCVAEGSGVCPELSREGAERLLTARARAFTDAFDELAAPKYDCAPATLPGLFGDPYPFEVRQLADRVTLTYVKDDVERTVWLEGHGHPEPPIGAFFIHGHSTGRYEGNQLVVDTTRFTIPSWSSKSPTRPARPPTGTSTSARPPRPFYGIEATRRTRSPSVRR